MAASVPRLAWRRAAAAPAIRRAVGAVSRRRLSQSERRWAESIETRRAVLLADDARTEPSFDPGSEGPAGDFSTPRAPTTVGDASRFMNLPRLWCTLLMRLVGELRPRACLELGTGFGISGSYLAAGLELNGAGELTTLEGAGDWAGVAERGFRDLGLDDRVKQRVGPIALSLAALDQDAGFDLAFVDAEHQAEPTLRHFEAMLPRLAPGAVVVFDDVDWPPMREAWRFLRGHERVALAAAVGRFGLVALDDREAPG